MSKRIVEVFVAGCQACDGTVELVQSLACPECEVRVLDLRSDQAAGAKAREHGVKRVPAVAVDGELAACCRGEVDAGALRTLGVGAAAS